MRVIPIAITELANENACNEGTGEVTKQDLPLARRSFLKGTGILMGTLVTGTLLVMLSVDPTASAVSSVAWKLSPALTVSTTATLTGSVAM